MLANRVKESSMTTGMDSLTLDGTTAGFQTFISQFTVNDRLTYTIESDSNQWEIGVGYLSSSTVLVREEILENSEGTTVAIDFTGTLSVFVSVATFETQNAAYATPDYRSAGTRMDGWVGGSGFSTVGSYVGGLFVSGYFMTGRKISQLGVKIDVLDALETGTPTTKVALYRLGNDSLPGKLIATTAALAADATGFIFGSITPVYIGPGPYFLAVLTASATAQYGGIPLNNNTANWQSSSESRPRNEHLAATTAITSFIDNPAVNRTISISNNLPEIRTRA